MSDYPKVEVPESCCEGEKNEDLRQIKDATLKIHNNWKKYGVSPNHIWEINEAAERMAEKIERLSKGINDGFQLLHRLEVKIVEQESSLEVLYGDVDEYEKEIARLKADNATLLKEIERMANVLKAHNLDDFVPKIPHLVEVVRCKNCKLEYRCNQKVFVVGETMNLRTITYCDAGESEGSNANKTGK